MTSAFLIPQKPFLEPHCLGCIRLSVTWQAVTTSDSPTSGTPQFLSLQVKKYNPNAKMVLRILTDDSKSVCRYVATKQHMFFSIFGHMLALKVPVPTTPWGPLAHHPLFFPQ